MKKVIPMFAPKMFFGALIFGMFFNERGLHFNSPFFCNGGNELMPLFTKLSSMMKVSNFHIPTILDAVMQKDHGINTARTCNIERAWQFS